MAPGPGRVALEPAQLATSTVRNLLAPRGRRRWRGPAWDSRVLTLELMASGGLYAELFSMQAAAYR